MSENTVFELWSFHRVLRKYLDTEASSICWNAIHVMAQKHIDIFCDKIRASSDTENFATLCKESVPYGYASCNLLRIGFRMLEDEEWKVLKENSFVALDDKDRVA